MVGILEVQLTKYVSVYECGGDPRLSSLGILIFKIVHTKPLTISSNTVLRFLVLVLDPAETNFFCSWSSALTSCDFLYPNHLSNFGHSSLCLDLKFLLDLKKSCWFSVFQAFILVMMRVMALKLLTFQTRKSESFTFTFKLDQNNT